MADAHFYKRGAIKLHLAEADREQINKFRSFVHYTGKAKSCTMNAMNPPIVKAIREKFGISNRKTYEPCRINWIKNTDLLFALVVGMLDGDGNIRLRRRAVSTIEMKLHGNWLNNLQFIEQFLYDYFDLEKINNVHLARLRKDGYAVLILSDRYLLACMRKKSEELNLPVMERKWREVDRDFISPFRAYRERAPKILALVKQGLKHKVIAQMLGVSVAVVSTTLYRERKKSA